MAIGLGALTLTTNVGATGENWTEIPIETVGSKPGSVSGVSCTSDIFCMAVGQYFEGTYKKLLLQWNGTKWTLVPVPLGISGFKITEVSCVGSNFCAAVITDSTINDPIFMTWNGSAWSNSTWTRSTNPLFQILTSVSCTSAVFCLAVGYQYFSGVYVEASFKWNGSNWTDNSPSNTLNTDILRDVTCVTTTFCVAVGDSWNGTRFTPVVLQWDGTSWAPETTTFSSSISGSLYGISCWTVNSCFAVGAQRIESTPFLWQNLILSRSGSTWNETVSPNESGVHNQLWEVSCVSSSACTAVGSTGNNKSLVVEWNGSAWVRSLSPTTVGQFTSINAISCFRISVCHLGGEIGDGEDNSTWLLYNPTPVPPTTTTASTVAPAATTTTSTVAPAAATTTSTVAPAATTTTVASATTTTTPEMLLPNTGSDLASYPLWMLVIGGAVLLIHRARLRLVSKN